MTEHRRIVEFVAFGKAAPKGSATAIRKGPRTIVIQSGQHALDRWTRTVRDAAMRALGLEDEGQAQPIDAPIYLRLGFRIARPPSHLRADGTLRRGAPEYPIGTPDRDKLERAVCDALTGLVYTDDSRVVDGRTSKVYTEPRLEGVRVEAYLIGAEALALGLAPAVESQRDTAT